MKNILRNSILLLWLSLFITSCHEEVDISKRVDLTNSKTEAVVNTGKESATNARQQPFGMVWIQLGGNPAEYITSYGTGITFGANFPHPITVDATGLTDGEPAGGFDFVGFRDVPTIYSSIVGNKFVLIQPTFPGGPSADAIYAYLAGLRLFWLGGGGIGERPAPLGSATGGGGTIEIRGQVVRDHTSPTNVSVVSDEYLYTPPPVNNPGPSNVILGTLQKNGYSIKFYGKSGVVTSGTVTQIEVRDSSNTIVQSIPLTITYALNYDLTKYHMSGTVKIGRSFLSLDDDMYTAW